MKSDRRYRTIRHHPSLITAAAAATLLVSILSIPSTADPYRSYDGSGNNAQHATWGAAGTAFQRLDPVVHYADGISAPSGADRPNPRDISNVIGTQLVGMPDVAGRSDYVWQWGQFLDHDITLTPTGSEFMPIAVTHADDPLAPMIPMMRSAAAGGTGGSVDQPREQMNLNSAYIDASMVYGSSPERAAALRLGTGGLLKSSAGNLLPRNTDLLPNANDGVEPAETLFLAGDVRANEQLGLTAMHTLFMREHNRLATELAIAHPSWGDEELYQQARRLVGGIVQHITYDEYLPALLGTQPLAPTVAYDPGVDATLSNEFASALFRLGHTQVSSQLLRLDAAGNVASGGNVPLAEAFFVPSRIDGSDEIDYLLRGLANQVQQSTDPHMIDTLRNAMFGDPGQGGLDLLSINIQRSRDHGLGSLSEFQLALGLPVAETWADITSNEARQAALELKYGSIDKVDLWIGALSEDPLPGSAVGTLLQTVISQQFYDLMVGDRFFYQWDPNLSASDLEMIASTRLADVIVRNTGIDHLRNNVFFVPEPDACWGLLAAIGCLTLHCGRRRVR